MLEYTPDHALTAKQGHSRSYVRMHDAKVTYDLVYFATIKKVSNLTVVEDTAKTGSWHKNRILHDAPEIASLRE